MTTAKFVQPNFTSQDAATYKAAIDAAVAVLSRIGGWFAPRAQDSPNMTVRVDAGFIFNGTTLTEVAGQNTGTITAPVGNPRIDRVVVDQSTGAVSVVTGTAAASPVAPAIPAGKLPICQVALATSTTSITNSLLTDERTFGVTNPAPAWTTATPTPTPESGSFTSAACTLRYLRIGKIVHVEGRVSITNAGTASGWIQIPLPVTQKAGNVAVGTAIETAIAAYGGTAWATGGVAYVRKYDATSLIVTGGTVDFSLDYEAD